MAPGGKSCSVVGRRWWRADQSGGRSTIQPRDQEEDGLHSGEEEHWRWEEEEERGEEGRDGAVSQTQARSSKHQQQGKDIKAGMIQLSPIETRPSSSFVQVVVEEAILYIEELQRQLKDRLEETLEEEERQHWEEMEGVVELDKVDKVDNLEEEERDVERVGRSQV